MILSLVTLIPAVVVVTSSNIVRAALSLVPTFLGVTGLYVMLQAEFVAGIQVLIYAGAITVLILFVIMLTEGGTGVRTRQLNDQVPLGAMAAVWLAFVLIVALAAVVGQVFALVIIPLAACEAAVGLALVMAAYRSLETIQVDEINLMKW